MATILVLLCMLGIGSSPEEEGPETNPGSPDGDFVALRQPVLGFAVERHKTRDIFRLVILEKQKDDPRTKRVIAAGTLEDCETRLVEALKDRYGTGKLNLPFATLGGKQFWGDLLIYCGWRIQENQLTGHCRLLDPEDTRRAWGSFEACRVVLEEERAARKLRPRSEHLVVLIHGLFRSKDSFAKLTRALEEAGYEVASVNYPSTRRSTLEHVAQLETVLNAMEGVRTVSFVTHSLGGIVARQLLARDATWKKRLEVSRLVMLAPPNRGSVVADLLKDWLPYKVLAGTAGQELTPEAVAKVPVPECSFGIIAGGTGAKTGLSPLLSGDNDGTVLVENTRLEGAADFLRVRVLHSFIMNDETAIEATLCFLKCGKFRTEPGS